MATPLKGSIPFLVQGHQSVSSTTQQTQDEVIASGSIQTATSGTRKVTRRVITQSGRLSSKPKSFDRLANSIGPQKGIVKSSSSKYLFSSFEKNEINKLKAQAQFEQVIDNVEDYQAQLIESQLEVTDLKGQIESFKGREARLVQKIKELRDLVDSLKQEIIDSRKEKNT